jgi:hypothetical protein
MTPQSIRLDVLQRRRAERERVRSLRLRRWHAIADAIEAAFWLTLGTAALGGFLLCAAWLATGGHR